MGRFQPILQRQSRDLCAVFCRMRHDDQPIAHGHASDEEINVANRSAGTAYEGLEPAELLGGGLIDEQHLRSGWREKGTHSSDIRLYASGGIGANMAQ